MAESLQIAAALVDRFSAPLRDLQTRMRNVVAEDARARQGSVKMAQAHRVAHIQLRESIMFTSRTLRGDFAPLMERLTLSAVRMGLGFGLAGGAVVAAGVAVYELGSQFRDTAQHLGSVGRAASVGFNDVRRFEALGPRIGVSAEQMDASLVSVSNHLDMLRAMPRVEVKAMADAGFMPELRDQVMGLKDLARPEQIRRILDIGSQIKGGPAFKRRFFEYFGLPGELASYGADEIKAYERRIAETMTDLTPAQIEAGQKAFESWQTLKENARNIRDYLGGALIPLFNSGYDAATKFFQSIGDSPAFEDLRKEISTFWTDPAVESFFAMPDTSNVANRLALPSYKGPLADLTGVLEKLRSIAQVIDDLNHGKVDWSTIFDFDGISARWNHFIETWKERLDALRQMMPGTPAPSLAPESTPYSPIAYRPGGEGGRSEMVRIIAEGVRQGFYGALFDFRNAMQGDSLQSASREAGVGGGGRGGPESGGGALAGRGQPAAESGASSDGFAAFVPSDFRRHRQRAMVVAKLMPEPDEKRGRGQKSLAAKHFPMVNAASLSLARPSAKGFSTRDIAEITGWSHGTIANDLRAVKDLTKPVKDLTAPLPSPALSAPARAPATGSAETKRHRAPALPNWMGKEGRTLIAKAGAPYQPETGMFRSSNFEDLRWTRAPDQEAINAPGDLLRESARLFDHEVSGEAVLTVREVQPRGAAKKAARSLFKEIALDRGSPALARTTA